MKQHIIIIEKDQQLVDSICLLLEMLNLKSRIFPNWSYKLKTLSREDIAAVFLNIDNLPVKPDEVKKVLIGKKGGREKKIPLIYFFRSFESSAYKTFSVVPHAAELKKPFSMEELNTVIRSTIELEPIKDDVTTMEDSYKQVLSFKEELDTWLAQLQVLVRQ